MIGFELFSRLYHEATKYSTLDEYISSQAEFVAPFPEAKALLNEIWELSRMNLKQLRKRAGINKSEFAERYGIPKRTIQNWETTSSCHREPPSYLKTLIAFTMTRN